MSFLFPAFLIGSLAVAIPIVLHLMKRDVAPRVAFSDIRFIRRAPMMRVHRRRLRELLLLAMRVSALLLLALAFARPFIDGTGALGRPVTVVALDLSFSMAASGMFEQARAAAVEALMGAPSGHAVAVVEFDHQARVVYEPSVDRAAAAATVGLLVPGAGATRFAAAISTAVSVIGSRNGRVVIVSDLQRSGWEEETTVDVPSRVPVEVVEVGERQPNLAISSLQVDRTSITVVADNDGPEESTIVTAAVDDRTVASRPVVLPTGSSQVTFDVRLPVSGLLEVSIADANGFPADDRRYALLDPVEPAAVGIVTRSGRSDASVFYLERALLAGEEDSPFSVTSIAATDLSARDLGEFAAVIVMSTEGLDRRGRERIAAFVSAGGGLLVTAGPSVEPALVADLLGGGLSMTLTPAMTIDGPSDGSGNRFSVTDSRHPVFQSFTGLVGTLAQIRVWEALRVTETERTRVLARFDDGAAALVEYEIRGGRAITFASDLNNEWNDFPRQPIFVPFVHELLRYLAGTRDAGRELGLDELPSGMEAVPGPARLPDSGRRVVVNVDPRESASARLTADAFASRIAVRDDALPSAAESETEADAVVQEAEQGYWWYALVAVGVLLVGEAWLGRSLA